MITIDVRYLSFEFSAEWDHVEHWDKTKAFEDGVSTVKDIKALDIIALSKLRNECLLLEVKDYRDQNDQEDARSEHRKGKRADKSATVTEGQTASALAEQVAQKIAGTLAGLVGAARMQDTRFAGDFSRHLAAYRKDGKSVRVVLWVEGRPTSGGKSARAKSNLETLTRSLKRKIGWLTRHPVQVMSTAATGSGIPGVKVTDNRP